MADVAKPTEIFLAKVEDGLGERHEVCCKTEKWSDRGINDIGRIQVKSVDDELHEVEDRWGKSIITFTQVGRSAGYGPWAEGKPSFSCKAFTP